MLVTNLNHFAKYYIIQSLLAVFVTLAVLSFLSHQHIAIVAAIGSTAFVLFSAPHSRAAQPKNVIGGYAIGFLSGYALPLLIRPSPQYALLVYALAVGVSMLFMQLTSTQHPPAAGAALGTAMAGFSFGVIMLLILKVIVVSLVHHLIKPLLKDWPPR